MKPQNSVPSATEPGDDLEEELRPEYEATVLKNGVRGKYLARYRSGTNLVCWMPTLRNLIRLRRL